MYNQVNMLKTTQNDDNNYSFIILPIYYGSLFFSITQEPQNEKSALLPNMGQKTPGLCRNLTHDY